MKYFIYWTSDVKSNKLWSSQLQVDFCNCVWKPLLHVQFFDALVAVIVVVANGPYSFVPSQLVPSAHGGSYNSRNPLRVKLCFRREVQIWNDVWLQHTECNAKESAHGLTTTSNITMPYLYKKVCRQTTNTALEYSLKKTECLLSDPFYFVLIIYDLG